METEKVVLCDTNILIEFYKNNTAIIAELQKIGQDNIAINAVIVGELIYGALNKKELQKILKDIKHLRVIDITPNICNTFIRLMTEFSLSHNLTLPDAIIAATALEKNTPLYTLNKKDFKYIKNLKLH